VESATAPDFTVGVLRPEYGTCHSVSRFPQVGPCDAVARTPERRADWSQGEQGQTKGARAVGARREVSGAPLYESYLIGPLRVTS
jgi:hypothetical protein